MLMTKREKRSVPAVAGTGLGREDLRRAECVWMREMSSETVEMDVVECVMRSHRALMAAMGCGSEGVDLRWPS